MIKVIETILAMMALSFVVAMAVAFAIAQTTKIIEKMNLASAKPEEIRRVKSIRKIVKRERRKERLEYERKSRIEMISHYYGSDEDNSTDNDLVTHFYPKK